MNEMNDERIRETLKRALAPMTSQNTELRHDLWPRMLRKLDQKPARGFWLDWVLLALLVVWCLIFPGVIPGLAYQL